MSKTVGIEVSEWAHGQMKSWAASNALTYISHFAGAGLMNTGEFNQMERWRRLSDDLSGQEFKPMDPAQGSVRDFDPAKVEKMP